MNYRLIASFLTGAFISSVIAQDNAGLPTVPADWKVETIIAAPQIHHPSVICAAPDGRIFVGEDPMDMPGPPDQPIDRVLCIQPGGKVTVFADHLYAVFGIMYLDGKVYVHHSPKLSVFTDDNGVGKDRVDLIETTNPKPWGGTGLNDHIPSNIRLAMDGYIYMSVGDKGIYGATGKDGSKAELHGGGLIRFKPDGTHLEVIATGTRNHLDVAINPEDEMFTYDNTDDGNGWWTRVTHMVDGGYYGYPYEYKPRQPYTLWMMADYGGGSPTGALSYNEDGLPADYSGNLFMCEWGKSQLVRFKVVREGGSYKIVSRSEFMTRKGAEFRPLGITVLPEGNGFYIADWNFGGWKANKDAGRVLKVTHTGKTQSQPKPDWYVRAASGRKIKISVSELIKALSHPAQSVRLVAQRRLADHGVKAIPALKDLLEDHSASSFARWSAIWALNEIDEGRAARQSILSAALDSDQSVQLQAIRQLGTSQAVEAAPELEGLLKSPAAAVRFRAATALGRIGMRTSVPALISNLNDKDLFARYAVFHALNRIASADSTAWAPIVKALANDDAAVREGAGFALRETYSEPLAASLSEFILESNQSMESRLAAVKLLSSVGRRQPEWKGDWWFTQPVKAPPVPKSVEWAGTKTVAKTLTALLADKDERLRIAAIEGAAAARDQELSRKLRETFTKEDSTVVQQTILRTLAAVGDKGTGDLMPILLRYDGTNVDLMSTAIEVVEKINTPSATAALVHFVKYQDNPRLLTEGIRALSALNSAEALPEILSNLNSKNADLQSAAIDATAKLGGDSGASALVKTLESTRGSSRIQIIAALGKMKSRVALPALIKAAAVPETHNEAILSLSQIPDISALDSYLSGLGGKNAALREACRKAIAQIAGQLLPQIEAKLQENQLPVETISELQRVYGSAQPITQWMVLGPFPNPTGEPFNVAAVNVKVPVELPSGKQMNWIRARANRETGQVDLNAQMDGGSDVTAYGVAFVDSPTDRSVEFVGGSDDSLTVWVNGKKVFEDLDDHGWSPDAYHFPVALRSGTNLVVAKIGQHGGDWAFSLRYPGPLNGRLFENTRKKPELADYAAFAEKSPGHAEEGLRVFNDVNGAACVKCHRVAGKGGEVGPDLSGVASKYLKPQLIEAVLYPSKLVLDGYQQTQVLTKDGELSSGIIRGETPTEITLVDTEGKKNVISKNNIQSRKTSDISLMPEGLHAGLSLQEFTDLISFLNSLRDQSATNHIK
jgi:putative heme-binding domain-containing protein